MPLALVSGASRGIGAAIAEELAQAGFRVACAARGRDGVEAVAGRIRASGAEAVPVELDVRDLESCRRAVGEVGPVDVLVNNAGVGAFGETAELDPAEWDRVISTNLTGAFYLTRAALPGMVERGKGHVVNIASVAGHQAFSGGGAYVASKYGLVGFSESLMLEARPKGVRVTIISPGSVATEFFTGRDTSWMLRSEDVAAAVRYAVTAPEHVIVDRIVLRTLNAPTK